MAVYYFLLMTFMVILPFTLSDLDDGGIESLDGKVRLQLYILAETILPIKRFRYILSIVSQMIFIG